MTPKLVQGALFWKGPLAIDADGCPIAYAPKGSGLVGLDYLANAGGPGNWYGLVVDSNGQPVVQGANDPSPGYYVSTTALCDHSKHETDPNRYVDSASVPYISIPPELKAQGVHLGDLCMVSYGDRVCAAVVADIGPHGKYGEGSIALAAALDINSSPKAGGAESGVSYIVFPGSGKGWPNAMFNDEAEALYEAWGGAATLAATQS